jgi:deoxyribonuclease-4
MFGSHLSIAGGLHHALLDAEALGCETVQVFTANQQQWAPKPPTDEDIGRWRAELRRLGYRKTVSHASYLINLASPDEVLRRKSVRAFVEEVRRCHALSIPLLVIHPGAHMGAGEARGLSRVTRSLDETIARTARCDVTICVESTAGQGTSLGWKLEHLQELIARVRVPDRLGVCLDTAHLFAAGYDFRGRKYDAFRKTLSATVGLRRVKVWHLNDSKKDLGSRVDRHEHIGRGTIGLDGFRGIVKDPAWSRVPKILETEKGTAPDGRDWDAINLAALRGMRG